MRGQQPATALRPNEPRQLNRAATPGDEPETATSVATTAIGLLVSRGVFDSAQSTSCIKQLSLTYSQVMTTTTALTFDILGSEFDLDQLNDIANHGCAAGVSGFIYSTELAETFDKYEDTIMSFLDDYAFDLGEDNGFRMVLNSMDRRGIEYSTLQIVKEQAVWMYVELMAVQLLQRNGHANWA